jgi:elongation factor 1-gamma
VKKEKKEAPKPAEVPKPAETPKPVEDVEDEEEAPVKKSKNPLDSLPPSPMVLDNWKRLYSNTKAKDFHLAINGITGYSYNWQFPICQAHQLILNRICV